MENNFDNRGNDQYSSYEEDDNRRTSEEASRKSDVFSLFLGDLSYFCKEADLQTSFSRFGEILDIRIIRNKATSKSLSYGFIDYVDADAAAKAMQEMNGKIVCGRAIKIKWACVAGNKEHEVEESSLIKYCLYVGDISNEIDESGLSQLFQHYGEIISLKLRTKQTEKGPVNFAFVEFSNAASAQNAMRDLDGNTDCGQGSRPLRVRWASNATAGSPNASSKSPRNEKRSDNLGDHTAVSIFTSFQATREDIDITDETLRNVFGRFAHITDAAIRLSVKDPDTFLQRGYGFVCFHNDNFGIAAAMRVTTEMAETEVDGVLYKCEPSRRLVQLLGGSKHTGNNNHISPGGFPPSSQHPHPRRTPRSNHGATHQNPPLSMQTQPMANQMISSTTHANYYSNPQAIGPVDNMVPGMQNMQNIPSMSPVPSWPSNVVWGHAQPAYTQTQFPPNSNHIVHSPHSQPPPPPPPSSHQYVNNNVSPGFMHFQQPLDPNSYNVNGINQQIHHAPLPLPGSLHQQHMHHHSHPQNQLQPHPHHQQRHQQHQQHHQQNPHQPPHPHQHQQYHH